MVLYVVYLPHREEETRTYPNHYEDLRNQVLRVLIPYQKMMSLPVDMPLGQGYIRVYMVDYGGIKGLFASRVVPNVLFTS